MVGDLLYKNSDLVVTSLTAMVERAKYIDFMPPITPFEIGLSIANLDLTEEYDYDTFISPFNLRLWNTIFVFAAMIGLTQCIISYFHYSLTLLDFFTFTWNSFVSNFGGRCFRLNLEDITSYKVSILTSLLGGTIIWMAYRSHLTSELSIYEQRYPFNDMESFSKTKWRLLTMGREHSTTKFLTTANPGSVYQQVHINNMNNESFHDDSDEAIKKVVAVPHTALWKDVSSTKISKEYVNCKVM